MSGSPHGARILYVGDEERDPEQLASKVDRGGVDVVPDAETAVDRVEERAYDCLVCEYELDETTGVGLASSVDEEAPTLPVVLAPTAGSEAIAGAAVPAPVTAYVPADGDDRRTERLTETVENVVEDERTVPDRRRLLAAIDTAAGAIALIDGDGHYEYVNEAYADLYGYEPDELLGRHKDVVYPDGRSFGDLVSDVRERSELQREAEFVRADGSTVWVEYSISTVGDGYVCTSRDVTERRRRQAELERRSSLLDSLFDQIPAHLYIKDEEGRHLRVSRYFMEREQVDEDAMSIAAYDRDHVVGKTDIEVNDSEHGRRAHEDDMRVIESGEPILNKEEYVAADDAWNLTSKVPWRDEDGDVRGLIGISQRITDQKAVEAEPPPDGARPHGDPPAAVRRRQPGGDRTRPRPDGDADRRHPHARPRERGVDRRGAGRHRGPGRRVLGSSRRRGRVAGRRHRPDRHSGPEPPHPVDREPPPERCRPRRRQRDRHRR
jgi:PAS domain S-box-containing protein